MKILKTYKFRLYPTEEQLSTLKQHGGNVRFAWNKLVEFSNNWFCINNKFPTRSELQKHLLTLKQNYPFLKLSHSQPLQYNALKLAKTFSKVFNKKVVNERKNKIAKAYQEQDPIKREKKVKKAMNFGYPKFKSKAQNNDNLFYPQYFKIEKNYISFPKLGYIKYIKHREIIGKALFTTIIQEGKEYYVSITCEIKQKDIQKPDLNNSNIVGIDLGIKKFATLSDGTVIKNPRTLKKHLKKLKRENQRLSKKVFDEETKVSSKNRIKQIAVVQRVYKKIRNIRKDFLHKTSSSIIAKYDGVVLEDLDIKEMLSKNKKVMNRNISDVSWYEFGRMIEYKSIWCSKHFIKVNRYYPSTKKCSQCGNMAQLCLDDRTYVCNHCKAVIERDYNASLNILEEGIKNLYEVFNTVATTVINACGVGAVAPTMKQEKVVRDEEPDNIWDL